MHQYPFPFLVFHFCDDAYLAGQEGSDGVPSQIEVVLVKEPLDAVDDVVGQDSDEEVSVDPPVELMVVGS